MKLPVAERFNVTVNREHLSIKRECYRKMVPPAKVLKTTPEERKLVRQTRMYKGVPTIKEKSKFTGFAMHAKSLEEVRAGYFKLKLNYGDATHISLAYRIPGVENAKLQDYSDDGEHGQQAGTCFRC